MSGVGARPQAQEIESRVLDWARACRTAVRAVAFYPPTHPAVSTSLGQIVDVSRRATSGGPLSFSVLPDSLLVNGLATTRPDQAISELASLLHRHGVGSFALHGGSDPDSWRRLLLLLSRPAEELRADGGIQRLWSAAGGASIEIREIDYGELLRGRIGGDSTELAAVISHYLDGSSTLTLEDAAFKALAGLIKETGAPPDDDDDDDADEAGAGSHRQGSLRLQTTAVIKLLRGLAEVTLQTQPERLDAVFTKAATVGGQLTPDTMLGLLDRRGKPDAMVGDLDVVAAFVGRMDDPTIARFLAASVLTERGPTGTLAEAFHQLVGDDARRRTILTLAQTEAARSPLAVEGGFLERFRELEHVLQALSSREFVSDDYARELDAAQSRAIDLDELNEDPPERIAAWRRTIEDGALSHLDLALLADLLAIEADPFRWREVLDTVRTHIEVLVRTNQFETAAELILAIAREADASGRPSRRPLAREALDQVLDESAVTHATSELRGSDLDFRGVRRFFHAVGSSAVGVLGDLWSAERDPRVRRRLQDIVMGFGAVGRSGVDRLVGSEDREVRRAAIQLVRESGHVEQVASLAPLLSDADERVRIDALRAIADRGEAHAFTALAEAVMVSEAARSTLVTELNALIAGGAAAPLCFVVRRIDHSPSPRGLGVRLVEALGQLRGPAVVDTLGDLLGRHVLWPPFHSRAVHQAAAASLARIGDEAAASALRQAAERGPRTARTAARRALESLLPA